MNDFRLIHPQSDEDLEAYYDLRWRVLRAPWGQNRGSEKDPFEDLARHLAVLDTSGRTVGVGRLHLLGPGDAQIRYMAVEEGFRNRGIGCLIYNGLESAARQDGISRIVVDARLPAVGFYEKMGFRTISDGHTLYDEIRHKVMEKDL